MPSLSRPDSPAEAAKIVGSQSDGDLLQEALDIAPSHREFDFDFDLKISKGQDTQSVVSHGGKSSRASFLTVSSLRRRLSFKYSDSCLGDIQSLMQNSTIAGSSAISTRTTLQRVRKSLSVTRFLHKAELFNSVSEAPSSNRAEKGARDSLKKVHPVVLPGSFPTYCSAEISKNRLRPCRRGADQLGGSDCCLTSRGQIIRHEPFHEDVVGCSRHVFDGFGNSEDIIAAACESPSYLLRSHSWISRDTVNNAGETILHLVQEPSIANQNDMVELLIDFISKDFNFNQRDHHGQTALHLLTRPWIPKEVLEGILSSFTHSNIPTSRDNLGYTIREQLEKSGVSVDTLNRLFIDREPPVLFENSCLPNYGHNTDIETIEDLEHYAQHAEVLRDIRRSLEDPLHEDAKGRNGLHCLAQVSLSVHLPGNSVTSNEERPRKQRERYMIGLLKSGVDVNNHDKEGFTPLMAFIIHSRAHEDDASTTRLLETLLDAKAGINTRDRQGQTPLHLAVKLGRRAATKFLLGHGANVHARDSEGLGVIAVGEAASRNAKHNETLYAQIMLCISLVVSDGGVAAPTILQEWASHPRNICDWSSQSEPSLDLLVQYDLRESGSKP